MAPQERYHVFSLPPTLLDSDTLVYPEVRGLLEAAHKPTLVPRTILGQASLDEPIRLSSPPPLHCTGVQHLTALGDVFANVDEQRAHFRSYLASLQYQDTRRGVERRLRGAIRSAYLDDFGPVACPQLLQQRSLAINATEMLFWVAHMFAMWQTFLRSLRDYAATYLLIWVRMTKLESLNV